MKNILNAYHIQCLKSSSFHFFIHVGRFRDKKNNFTNGENYGHQKMNSINVNKEKNQILKTFYGKHSIYFSDLKKK